VGKTVGGVGCGLLVVIVEFLLGASFQIVFILLHVLDLGEQVPGLL
jgi:hypothetical protein